MTSTSNAKKIAAVGTKDSVLAFKAVGIEIFTVENCTEADKTVKRLTKEQYGVILITEDLASLISPTLLVLKSRQFPVVLLIPSSSGVKSGYATTCLKYDIEKAVGTI